MSDRLRVSEAMGLMTFLTTHLKGWTRSRIKQRLKAGCVMLNGASVSRHDHPLNIGDDIEVLASARNTQHGKSKLEVLYSDSDLIAINKPAGLLSVATAKESKHHALAILRDQLSRPKHPVKLWPVHRLDRDTSGVLLFATSDKMREIIMTGWRNAEKTYLAIVEGKPNPSHGIINQPLRLDEKEYRMHVGPHSEAKEAISHYETQRNVNDRSLMELRLDTGRQHQIRAHLAWLGHSVIGDPRYGTDGPRMGLHALSLSIDHPKTGKRLTFKTHAPSDFLALLT